MARDKLKPHDRDEQSRPDDYGRAAKAVLATIVVVGLAAAAYHSTRLQADPDEYEHLHAAWLWSKGIQPFTGFFEHHPPLYWLILRPVIASADQRDLVDVITRARIFSWAIACAAVAGCWYFFSAVFGRRAAWCGTALLAGCCAMARHWVHIRPDVASLGLMALGSGLAVKGMGVGKDAADGSAWRTLAGGVLIGLSLCLLTKTVFWAAALLVVLAAYAFARARGGGKAGLARLAAAAGGLAIPGAVHLAWILLANDFAAFWHDNVTVNRALAGSVLKDPWQVYQVWKQVFSWPLLPWPLAIVGLGHLFAGRQTHAPVRKALIAALLVSSIALILLGNGPWPQYALPLIVLIAGLAGVGLAFVLDRMPARGRGFVLAGLLVVTIAWVSLPTVARFGKDRSDLSQSVRPLQAVLDMSRPAETYLGVQHWNPIFLMDADPKLFIKLVVRYDPATIRELAEVIRTNRPRFIIGSRTPIWTANGRYFPLRFDELAVVKENYRSLDDQNFVMVRTR